MCLQYSSFTYTSIVQSLVYVQMKHLFLIHLFVKVNNMKKEASIPSISIVQSLVYDKGINIFYSKFDLLLNL